MPAKKKKIKVIVVSLLGLMVVLAGLFFYVNSGTFVRTQVVPRIGNAIGEELTVEEASFSLFSHLSLTNLRMGPSDSPKLSIDTIKVRFKGMKALTGSLLVPEVTVTGVKGDISKEDIDSWLANLADEEDDDDDEDEDDDEKKSSTIAIQAVNIRDVDLTYRQDGQVMKISKLVLGIPEIANGKPLNADITLSMSYTQQEQQIQVQDATVSVVGVLNQDMMPDNLTAKVTLPLEGELSGTSLADWKFDLTAAMKTPQAGKQPFDLALQAIYRGAPSAVITADGTVQAEAKIVDLQARVDVPQPDLLNLIGALGGDFTFGRTKLNLTTNLHLDPAARSTLVTALQVYDLTITSESQQIEPFQPLSISMNVEAGADVPTGMLDASVLSATINDGKRDLATVSLDKPVQLAILKLMSQPQNATSEPVSLRLASTDLPLAIAAPFLPKDLPLDLNKALLNATVLAQVSGAADRIVLNGGIRTSLLGIVKDDLQISDLGTTTSFHLKGERAGNGDLSIVADSLTTTLQQGVQPWIQVDLTSPFQVGVKGKDISQSGTGTIRISSPGMPLGVAGSLLPADIPVSIADSQALLDAEINIASLGKYIQVKGSLPVKQLQLRDQQQRVHNLDATVAFQLGLNDQRLEKSEVNCVLSEGKRALLESSISATGLLSPMNLAFELDLKPVSKDGIALVEAMHGQLDLAKTSLSYHLKGSMDDKLIHTQGELTVADLFPTLKGQPKPAIKPLNVKMVHNTSFDPTSQELAIKAINLSIHEGNGNRGLAAELTLQPTILRLKDLQKSSRSVLQFKASQFDLSAFEPLLPPALGIKRLRGIIETGGTVTLNGLGQEASVNLSFAGSRLEVEKADSLQVRPFEITLNLDADYDAKSAARIKKGHLLLADGTDPLAALDLTADLDPALKRKSNLSITANQTINLDRLLKLVKTQESKEEEPSAPGEPEAKDQGFLEQLWLTFSFKANTILYRKLRVTGLTLAGELKNGELVLRDDTGMVVNEAPIRVRLAANMLAPDGPTYDGAFSLKGLTLAPIMASFAPKADVDLAGAIRDLNLTFSGKGFDAASLRDNLSADGQFLFDQLQVTNARGWTGLALELLIFKNFNMSYHDLAFSDGGGPFSLKNRVISTPGMRLGGGDILLSWDGNAAFNGNNWVPNFSLVPEFQGNLAKRLLKKDVALKETDNGTWRAPALSISGPVWEKTHLTKMSIDYAVKLGKLDPKYQGINTLLDAFSNPKTNTIQPESGDRQNQDKPAEKPKVEDLIDGALKGIFGR